MSVLTKENAKYHCRTCLRKLNTESSLVENHFRSENFESNELGTQDIKDFGINITTNKQLQYLLLKYADEQRCIGIEDDVPQNVCIDCYEKLQTFDKFCEQALESVERLRIIFTGNKDGGNIEFEYITKAKQSERVISHDGINQPLLKDTLLGSEAGLLGNKELAMLSNGKVNDSVRFEITEIAGNNILKTGESARVSSDCLEWKQSVHNEGHIQSDTIKIERKISEDMPFSNFGDDIKMEYEYMDNEQQNDANICRSDFYKSSLNDTLIKSEAVSLDKNALNSIEVQNSDALDRTKTTGNNNLETNESRTLNLYTSDWRKYVEVTSNTITFKNNLRNSEQCAANPNEKGYTKKKKEKIRHHNSIKKNIFKCTQCNHSFLRKINLDAHVRKVHEGNKRPFQCDRCDKSYTFHRGLHEHIKEVHETEVRSYSCDNFGCDRVYTSLRAMREHKRLKHSGNKSAEKHVCEECGAKFTETRNLKAHRRNKHPGEAETEELFECEICNKTFRSRYTLKYHALQMHSNNKTPCEHCGIEYGRIYELQKHIRTVHMKLKPFKCQYCSKSFALRKTLKHHEYTHTGEKPYECDICGQTFRNSYSLYNHSKSHKKLNA